MPTVIGRGTKTSTNTYANVFTTASLVKSREPTHFVVQYIEGNVNAVTLKVVGSNDGTNFEDVILDSEGATEVEVLKDGHGYVVIQSTPFVYLNVQVKSTVDDTHGSLTVLLSQA